MAANKQTTNKTSVPALIPQPHGGALRSGGKPGNRGGLGRPPDEFKRIMGELATRKETLDAIGRILADPNHQHFVAAWKLAAGYGFGPPNQKPSEEKEGVKVFVFGHPSHLDFKPPENQRTDREIS